MDGSAVERSRYGASSVFDGVSSHLLRLVSGLCTENPGSSRDDDSTNPEPEESRLRHLVMARPSHHSYHRSWGSVANNLRAGKTMRKLLKVGLVTVLASAVVLSLPSPAHGQTGAGTIGRSRPASP